MKAVVLQEHGPLEALKVRTDIELPPLKSDEIRVEVKYCALNHLDLWLRYGGTGDRISLPRIPGSDIAGIVIDVGDQVRHLKAGDRVLIYPGIGCGHCPACAKGNETQCHQFQIVGYHVDGGYAEQVQVPAHIALKIPEGPLAKWAAVPVSYVTAWNALVKKCRIGPNDTVLIWGAAGGLGFAAVSIAKGFGAKVIGIVNSEEKVKFLQQQGFEGEFLVRDEHLEKTVRSITGKRGVDIVLDHAGKATWARSLKMLARGGRLACCGVTTGPMAETDLRYIFGKQLQIYGSWMGDRSDLLEVIAFLERTNLFPYIYKEFPLESAKQAQECMEKGEHVGKIVLKIKD